MKYNKLFTPFKIGNLEIKNRMFMAPMSPNGCTDSEGCLIPQTQEYYVERARGGIGLIITGMCNVDYNELIPKKFPCPNYAPSLFAARSRAMVNKIHSYDTKIFLQLSGGMGRSGILTALQNYIAPSENPNRFDPNVIHREMTHEEVKTLIKNFISAAEVAKRAGFDGVEIHAIHEGYLLDQFALSAFNRRTDEYGGSLENRLRVATEIVQGIKEKCGKDFVVSVRYSLKSYLRGYAQGILPGEEFEEKGRDIAEGIEAAKILVDAGYDCLNTDAGIFDAWYWNHPPMYFNKHGIYNEFGKILKENVDIPILIAGRMDDPQMANDSIDTCCDMVGFARPLLADAYLPLKLQTGREDEIRKCLSCHQGCSGRVALGMHPSCAINPQAGREMSEKLIKTDSPKRVLIAGGGIAGMEAAYILKQRGHEPIIFEKSDRLGGVLNIASIPDFKKDERRLITWYQRELDKLNIEIHLNMELKTEYVAKYNGDAIILATGAKSVMIDGCKDGHIISLEQAMKIPTYEKIVVIGGGQVGCETAYWLGLNNKKVTLIEQLSDLMSVANNDVPIANKAMLIDLVNKYTADVMLNTKAVSADANGITVQTKEETIYIPAEAIVIATGFTSDRTLYYKFIETGKPVYTIGDSRKFHNIMQSVWDAFEIAKSI